MIDFEDNNPFSGSDRRLSSSSGVASDMASLDIHDRDAAESNAETNQSSVHNRLFNGDNDHLGDDDDDDDDDAIDDGNAASRRAYSSRVEQILYEHNDAQITISEAGKSKEGSSRGFITYTIRLMDIAVRRRYSEFESLRITLVKLFPTLIIPPIPEKHTMSDYAAAPTKAKEDTTIIEHRRRMLAVFLNRCKSMKHIRESTVYQRFLDPNASWSEVLTTPPVSLLPKQILKAPPFDPSGDSIAHSYLPVPPSSARLRVEEDPTFQNAETNAKDYEGVIVGGLEKVNRKIIKRYSEEAVDLSELGAKFNAFSLEEHFALASSIEKVGQAIDNTYISTEALIAALSSSFSEPLGESAQFAAVVRSVLKFRRQKALQLEITADSLAHKKAQLESLERTEQESQRINSYLHRDLSARGTDSMYQSSYTANPSLSPTVTATSDPLNSNHEDTSRVSSETLSSPINEDPVESFPPTHADSVPVVRSHKKKKSVFKIPGISKLNNAIHSMVDNDPEVTRRNNIGKTKEQIAQLELALSAAKEDVEQVSDSVKKDLERFQQVKEDDLKRMMVRIKLCIYLAFPHTNILRRTLMSDAMLKWPERTWKAGKRPKLRLTRFRTELRYIMKL